MGLGPHQRQPPFPPPGYPPQGQYGGFYPPPPGPFGRGYGPPPPAGYNFNPYGPPPPGYYGPPGQGFPPGPNRFPQQPPPVAIGPPGQRSQPPTQPNPPTAPVSTTQTLELPSKEAKSKQTDRQSTPSQASANATVPPPASAPQTQAQSAAVPSTQPPTASKIPPTGPKRTTPAVPFTVNQKSFVPPTSTQPAITANGASAAAKPAQQARSEMEEASRQAKEAVAAAMAKLQPQNTASVPAPSNGNADALTQQMSQLSTTPATTRGRGSHRGTRGQRQGSGGHRQKVEIPQSDFDFESANAKFNKEDLIKEAIASGSPAAESVEDPVSAHAAATNAGPARKDSLSGSAPLYNKKASFFDDISSDAKDREEDRDTRTDGRALRGQEFRRNVETFGQGNVDTGYRGRGRGAYRGRPRGQNANYRGRARGSGGDSQPPAMVQN